MFICTLPRSRIEKQLTSSRPKSTWRELMKAIVWTKYGPPDGLQVKEVAKPAPKDHEVLIRIYATTVTAADCELRSLKLPIWLRLPLRIYLGLIRPRNMITGQELAGEGEAVGNEGRSQAQ